jgi:Tfp pilus assembly protein PilP
MNQRVIFFVALVCIAQLGVTLARNFWSEQSRKVQHVSLARTSSPKTIPPNTSSTKQRDESVTTVQSPAPKKNSNASKIVSPKPTTLPTPANPDTDARTSAVSVANQLNSPSIERSVEPPPQPQLPSANLASAVTTQVAKVSQKITSDPFVPFFSIRRESEDNKNRSLTEYNLDELKVTAIIADSHGGHLASVKAPTGRNFIVKPGTMIGAQGGRVIEISPSTVLIAEPSNSQTDPSGITQRKLSLRTPSTSTELAQLN